MNSVSLTDNSFSMLREKKCRNSPFTIAHSLLQMDVSCSCFVLLFVLLFFVCLLLVCFGVVVVFFCKY